MTQRLLNETEATHYQTIVESYTPSDEAIVTFAESRFAVIAGPTGAGKDTLRNSLIDRSSNYTRVLSTTTRPLRPGEQDGVDYNFRELEFFDQGFAERRFLQAALVHGQQISCLDVVELHKLNQWQTGLAILVVQTEVQLRVINPALKTIFLIPPDRETLLERMQKGREMHAAELDRRIEAARSELEIALGHQDYYCVVSDDIERMCNVADEFLGGGEKNSQEDTRARDITRSILSDL